MTSRWNVIVEAAYDNPNLAKTPAAFQVLGQTVLASWPGSPPSCLTCLIAGHNSAKCPRKTGAQKKTPLNPPHSYADAVQGQGSSSSSANKGKQPQGTTTPPQQQTRPTTPDNMQIESPTPAPTTIPITTIQHPSSPQPLQYNIKNKKTRIHSPSPSNQSVYIPTIHHNSNTSPYTHNNTYVSELGSPTRTASPSLHPDIMDSRTDY